MGKNLFELIPSSQSENISSAALAYCLQNSHSDFDQIRRFFGIETHASIKELTLEKYFEERGRIDLYLETEDQPNIPLLYLSKSILGPIEVEETITPFLTAINFPSSMPTQSIPNNLPIKFVGNFDLGSNIIL